jgi:hypothetical protein
VIAGAVVVVIAAAVLAMYSLDYSMDSIPASGTRAAFSYRVHGRDYSEVAAWTAAVLSMGAWSAIAGMVVRYEDDFLAGAEPALSIVLLVIAAVVFGIGTLIVGVSGAVIGAGAVSTSAPQFEGPNRPRRRSPSMRPLARRSHGPRDPLGTIIETFARVVASIVNTAGNSLVVIGLVAGYCVALAWYAFCRMVVTVAARICWHAVVAAWQGMIHVIVSILVPASALLGTPWIIIAAAGETRRYLVQGPLIALGLLFILLLAAAFLTLGTWTILANQHLRESLRSAGRAIPATIGYGAPVILVGGWLLGVPGELGYGRIRLGPLTYTLTGAAVIAVVTYFARGQRVRQPAPGTAPVHGPPARSGRAWSIGIALLTIAGTVISVAFFVPGRGITGTVNGVREGNPPARLSPSSPVSKPPLAPTGHVPPSTDPGQAPIPAGATRGYVDLGLYCRTAYPGHYAVLRFANAWGWRCAVSPAQAQGNRAGDLNVIVDDACAEQYGSGVLSHFGSYYDPNSWFCYRI